jgi:flavin reductase (DIM6/NTAB) family NADH-FMN oxidoreductase RutF
MSDEKLTASAVGHIPSGLFIITAKNGETVDGYLASWVQQISFKPLMVALAVNPDRPGYETIVSGDTFSINVVGDHDTQYMRHFWSGYTSENNPFKEIPYKVTEAGGVSIDAAKSSIDCKFVSKSKPGDHEIVIAEVIASHVLNEESVPKTHVRKSGLDY